VKKNFHWRYSSYSLICDITKHLKCFSLLIKEEYLSSFAIKGIERFDSKYSIFIHEFPCFPADKYCLIPMGSLLFLIHGTYTHSRSYSQYYLPLVSVQTKKEVQRDYSVEKQNGWSLHLFRWPKCSSITHSEKDTSRQMLAMDISPLNVLAQWPPMISSHDVRVNQSSWSTRRKHSLRVRDGMKRSSEETRNCSRAAVVSGWNACAGGFNRERGRGRGDSIVALQLGLVRVSRLAAQPRYAPLAAQNTLSFSSLAAARSVVGFATEGETRFHLKDLVENFLSADLVLIIRPASWRNGNAYAIYVFNSVYSGNSLLARPADCRGVSRRACATIVSTYGFGTRDRSDYSRFSQRTITGRPSCCRVLDVIKSDA